MIYTDKIRWKKTKQKTCKKLKRLGQREMVVGLKEQFLL